MTGGGNQVWDSKLEYILSAVGYAVGLGNIWKFPYECFSGGGGAFLLPYIIMMIIVGFPLMLLETSLGQFTSSGPIKAYKCVPLFQGLGYAMMIISAIIGIFYNVILSWNLYYITKSVSLKPEYNTCQEDWLDSCDNDFRNATNNNCTMYPQEYFYKHKMLEFETPKFNECLAANSTWNQDHDFSIYNGGGLNIHLTITLLISWLIIMFVVIRGVQTSGKIMIYITLFPAVAMILMLIRGLFLKGAWKGIKAFLNPDFGKINPFKKENITLWIKATGQIFFSMSIGLGGLTTLSSYNQFRGNIFKDTLIILCSDFLVSIVSGLTVFTYLGYMSETSGIPIKDVATKGPGLVFNVWPFALGKIFGNGLGLSVICFVFFSMIYSTGISSMAGLTETIINCFEEILSKYDDLDKDNDELKSAKEMKRAKITACVTFICFILGLPMVMKNGISVFAVLSGDACNFSLIMIAIFELIAIMYFYGHDRFLNDIRMMLHKIEVPWIIVTCWRFIAPLLLVILLVNQIINANYITNLSYGGLEYKVKGSPFLFFIMVLSPLIIIIIGALHACGIIGDGEMSFRKSTIPDVEFGPAADSDRIDVSRRLDDVTYSTFDMKCGIEIT